MRHHVLVGTFHKTGTNWIRTTFGHMSETLAIRFMHMVGPGRNDPRIGWPSPEALTDYFRTARADVETGDKPGIFFEWHGHFPPRDAIADCTGMVTVRDPRDVLISGANYHVHAREHWLHVSDPAFGGRTYCEQINSYRDFEDRIRFEMDNVGGHTIRSMAAFECGEVFRRVPYEKLIADHTLQYWHGVLVDLGFEGVELPHGLYGFWFNAIFGGKAQSKDTHIHSGAARQWESAYSDKLLAEVEAAFGGEIERLGYPLSTDLPAAKEQAAG